MRNLDCNKIQFVVGVIFIVLFIIFLITDYINYYITYNIMSFYINVITRTIQYALPGVILIYLYNQNTYVKESKYVIKDVKLPDEFNGYKIAQISDFHNTNSKRLKDTIIQKLKKFNPDIIVITGDMLDSRRTNVSTVKEFLNILIEIADVYYVLGNHEARITNIEEIVKEIENIGINILRNEIINITRNDKNIEIGGIDDPLFNTVNEENKQMQIGIQEKLNNIITNSCNFKVLLSHRPEFIQVYAQYDLDLVFTGHAHGGQIRIPFIGGIFSPGQGIFPKYTDGIHELNDTKMIVSRGIGNSRFPFRINNRPELVLVTLRREG